jgi:hypothetical protein
LLDELFDPICDFGNCWSGITCVSHPAVGPRDHRIGR